MIIDYKDYVLHVNLLTYNEDDLEWELEDLDDLDPHTRILDQLLHDDYIDEINDLIIAEVQYQNDESKLERQLSDLDLN